MPPSILISVAARTSPLSRAQVQELLSDLQSHHPHVHLEGYFLKTTGDLDQKTSLRTMGKTDFFTKEVDALVLNGVCRLAVHSAKDLPDPIPEGLELICLTKGVDPADVLVLRDGETLDSLPSGAKVATSSVRREDMVMMRRDDLAFIDLRGTIQQRLDKLNSGEADAVVIAEAALIRLGLTHLNRIWLPGPTVEGQGQLAVVARAGDAELRELFACLDVRF